MAAVLPRIQISLDPDVDAVLVGLSRHLKKPKASLVRQWLQEAVPALRDAVEALRLAEKSEKRAMEHLVRMADRETTEVNQLVMPLRRKPGRPRKRG